MQNQDFDIRIFSDLPNTGETLGQKVRPLRSFEPELSLPLVQSSFARRYLMKAKYREMATEKCMVCGPCHNKTKNNLRQEKEVSGYN
jgi:hypothetical protein